jgi:hypothetical protein
MPDDRVEKYIKFRGRPLMALQDDSGPTEHVTKLPPIKGARQLSRPKTSAYPESPADPPPRPITQTSGGPGSLGPLALCSGPMPRPRDLGWRHCWPAAVRHGATELGPAASARARRVRPAGAPPHHMKVPPAPCDRPGGCPHRQGVGTSRLSRAPHRPDRRASAVTTELVHEHDDRWGSVRGPAPRRARPSPAKVRPLHRARCPAVPAPEGTPDDNGGQASP